jgi:uncharacterized protein
MSLNRILVLALLPAGIAAAQTTPASTQHDPIPVISTSASASTRYNPDRATINISVQTKARTAAAAAADNATRQNAVMSALRALGISNDQLSTTGYNVNPEYRYETNQSPVLVGYTVTNTVQVDVHDLKQLGKILDTALANGSNVISSLDFYASDTGPARQQALMAAVAKAHADATVAAKAAGGTLGPLVHLNVSGGNVPQPVFAANGRLLAGSAGETRINPGQQSISVSISGEWRFIPSP